MLKQADCWSYQDVTIFLQQHGFEFSHPLERSQQAWVKLNENGEPDRIVEVTMTDKPYVLKILRKMVRQAGIPKEDWIKLKKHLAP
jgi:hypothetical protein